MSVNPRFGRSTALALLACAALASCSSTSRSAANPVNWITPYKIDVIQGNFISREQVEALRAGMPRDQVKAILGTPLLASLFHADRWDYVFTLKRQGVEPQVFRYAVFFKNDQLVRFEGDQMPTEAEFIARLDSRRKLAKVPPLEATEAQLQAASRQPAAGSRAAAAQGTAVSAGAPLPAYPPLESPAQ